MYRSLSRQYEIFGTQSKLINLNISMLDPENCLSFRQTQKLQLLDLENLSNLLQEISWLDHGIRAEESSLALHTLRNSCDAGELQIACHHPLRGGISKRCIKEELVEGRTREC